MKNKLLKESNENLASEVKQLEKQLDSAEDRILNLQNENERKIFDRLIKGIRLLKGWD